tara:strand:- start:3647 stop:3961 length:315 start_codon:yes stop_codon:yes gene_type:complete
MELILTVVACFVFTIIGAVVGGLASARLAEDVVRPLIKELHYAIKHISAHDLQVYHGVSESDWSAERPHFGPDTPRSREQMAFDAEELARELDRYNGNLPPTAE